LKFFKKETFIVSADTCYTTSTSIYYFFLPLSLPPPDLLPVLLGHPAVVGLEPCLPAIKTPILVFTRIR
jgi:hypothetical protein